MANETLQEFVKYFGELGERWGLPLNACKVHAYLYIKAEPISEVEIAKELGFDRENLSQAVDFLIDYKMIQRMGDSKLKTSNDPWDMLSIGLEERRKRELPRALETLRACNLNAQKEGYSTEAKQIKKILDLVESIAVLDTQFKRISPTLLKGALSFSSTAAKFIDRTFGTTK